jgi:hypothetical protein
MADKDKVWNAFDDESVVASYERSMRRDLANVPLPHRMRVRIGHTSQQDREARRDCLDCGPGFSQSVVELLCVAATDVARVNV